MAPRATRLIDPADVPACADCGGRAWLDDRCLSCPTGLMKGTA